MISLPPPLSLYLSTSRSYHFIVFNKFASLSCIMSSTESRSRFFRIFLADSSQRLIIPSKFTKNPSVKLPETVEITNASGKKWRVRVRNNGSCFSLEEGWGDFAMAESLQLGDFLMFTFDGRSRFRVLVFGPNGCEKGENGEEREMGRRKLSEMEERARERAERFVESLGGSRPCFVVVVWPSHLIGKCKARVPHEFAEDHLGAKSQSVKLEISGKQWEVSFVAAAACSGFLGGFRRFAAANGIRAGDSLVFELLRRRRPVPVFHVTVFPLRSLEIK